MPETNPAADAGQPAAAELSAEDLALFDAEPPRRSDPSDIGPYRVLARLGGGGMGRLYLGRESDTEGTYGAGALVAVKVIRSEYAEDERFRRRFEREVEAVRRVHGTYTAELLDSGFDRDELLWMATAYVPGLSLADAIVRCGPLPVPVVRRLVHEIGQALTAIAAVGIVHRDLKPSNVLLGPDGARIIDFGVAHTADASSLTMTGQHLGTPAFMSPEQADGHEVGTASDVFSLGSVLAMAVTGSAPFGEGTTGDVIHRIIYSPPSEQVLAEVARRDPDLAELIGRCLDKDPRRRPSPQDVVEATRGHAADGQWPGAVAEAVAARAGWHGTAVAVRPMDQLTVLRRTKPEDPGEERAARRRWPLAVGAAAVAAIAAAAVAVAASGGDSARQETSASHAGSHTSASATRSPHATPASPRKGPRHTAAPSVTVTVPPPDGNPPAGGATDPAQPRQPNDPPPATSGGTTKPAPHPAPAKPWKSCTYYSGTRLTQSGDQGAPVKEVQCILKARGYNIGPSGVDGIFGYDTLAEVKRFQSDHHLRVDGQVGIRTWAALRS
ncbi:peptidoglycan hydrolase-like protein with peptidoglycan-binding domain/tRNA A-37 threonylcarbamoyl transferase component Bud32 [Streptomyces griseochromogenes]|uniref:non-specific serine/threonine protein kinase n=1 Tax=Streptomyces griseochromogenes TaxID=68214 RepID=A0A1B1B286_9ACTN|nr:serine/threonine-protein kinase [Streptomyces griseochromogenes]ANP52935.1 serine/threonine protein kinase [Streptomyces griseochromogenes]MBP2047578.1 peptidoglycan hydrolase-like protein with peptidoglycan-binding domain/tRNA A-37 threonylcarbamoyl transferase component Bud32 [Streptomyces griseochromogenes]